jgi:hypothetical protein
MHQPSPGLGVGMKMWMGGWGNTELDRWINGVVLAAQRDLF